MNVKYLEAVVKKHVKNNPPQLSSGDVVRVHQKVKEGNKERIQIFEGIVLRVRGGLGINGTFTVRRTTGGIGIERTFPLHLPSIVKVEKVKQVKLRQSRPYYLRTMTAKQLKKKTLGDLGDYVVFEEQDASHDEEEIKTQQEAEAKARAEAEAQKEAEAEAEVAKAKARHETQENPGTQEGK
ncbi:50S ribosomal protein L19 [Candidatus Berkelbacteria bacterium]|nr:50S ribosomal protein L19 [Candidatus Berkelbacteria bacterium]